MQLIEHNQEQHNATNVWTSIRISRKTAQLLDQVGKFKESYDDALQRILKEKLSLQPNEQEMSF
jgi:hypothetical protein